MDCRSWMSRAAAAAALLAGACDDGGGTQADPERIAMGQALYDGPVEGGNTFACATCHAMDDAEAPRRVGHPLGGATKRDSFKNGQLGAFEDAANSCLVEWMNADPWDADDERMLALRAFVDAGSGAEEDISFRVVQPPANLAGGDAEAGRTMFNASCIACHGPDGEGTLRAIAVGSGELEPSYVARRVRTSGRPGSVVYDGLSGGVMPFWSEDRLSDAELRDVVAYLSRNFDPSELDPEEPDMPDPEDPEGPEDPDMPDDPSDCAATHPKVGQSATLVELFHDVGGVAEIVDNCTIEIRDFNFDGQGIDVQIYAGFEGMYEDGFSISENLVRDLPYNSEVLTMKLPEGRTLDELGGVSVWCVPVGADFGSGTFQ